MKPLNDFLTEKREVTIHTLTSYVRQHIDTQWQPCWQEHHDELLRLYEKAGDQAYGVYGRALFQPLQGAFTGAGFRCEPGLPGHFLTTSAEYWGPPEERERCLWCVVHTADGVLLGTIVTQIFHDHTRFCLPHPPRAFALEATDTPAITEALTHAAVRLRGAEREKPQTDAALATAQSGWEYSVEVGLADCLDPQRLEISEAMLDGALGLWGRYGWELVTAIPHAGRMIAFFRRPARVSA